MNIFLISLVLLSSPVYIYGIDYSLYCWCQQGPSTYQELVDNTQQYSGWASCFLDGNDQSTNTCFDAHCPGGNWVLSNYYDYNEVFLSVTSADDCIVQCTEMGNGYNIANMHGSGLSSSGNNDDIYDYDDDDYDNDGSTALGITLTIFFLIICSCIACCVWLARKRRDNTNDTPPNCCYKFFCPTCAVLSYQGCESKSDVFMVCCVGNLFTMFCWEPKKVRVYVDNHSTVQQAAPTTREIHYVQPEQTQIQYLSLIHI